MEITAMEKYRYTPLRKNEIRLLEILPGPDNIIVSCHIEHFLLDNLPEYSALSYTWGTSPARLPVFINNQSLLINSDLNDALLRFRAKPVRFEDYAAVDRFQRIAYRILRLLKGFDRSHTDKGSTFTSNESLMQDYIARGNQQADHLRKAYHPDARHLRVKGQIDDPEVKLQRIIKLIEDLWTGMAAAFNLPTLSHESRLMWIDAICINQEDFEERAEQVKLMRDIYKRSHWLAIWLGCQEDESELGFSAMRRLEELTYPGCFDSRPGCLFRTNREEFDSICKIFERPYFTRSWVLQEYVLGSLSQHASKVDHAIFCCGFEQTPNLITSGPFIISGLRHHWEGRKDVLRRNQLRELLQPFLSLRSRCRLMTQIRHQSGFDGFDEESVGGLPMKQMPDLLGLLWLCFGSKSTDPRDKVYSLMGMAEELSPSGIPNGYSPKDLVIDYHATVSDVFSSSVRSIVTATKRLDILGYCQKQPESDIKRSWIPDWSGKLVRPIHEDFTATILERWEYSHGRQFDATNDTTSICKFSTDIATLTVTGFILERVWFADSPKEPTTHHQDTETNIIATKCRTLITRMQETFHYTEEIELFNHLAAILIPAGYYPPYSTIEQLPRIRNLWSRMLRDWVLPHGDSELLKTYDLDTTLGEHGVEGIALGKVLREAFLPGEDSMQIVLTSGRNVAKTRPTVKRGDLICLILGCARPMVLREINGHFILIADIWIEGVMHGEIMERLENGEFQLEEFELH